MHFNYRPNGVCSTKIEFDIDEGKVKNVKYENGCNGNLQAISKLVEGMDATALVSALKGLRCGYKDTSCTDQLAHAVEEAIKA